MVRDILLKQFCNEFHAFVTCLLKWKRKLVTHILLKQFETEPILNLALLEKYPVHFSKNKNGHSMESFRMLSLKCCSNLFRSSCRKWYIKKLHIKNRTNCRKYQLLDWARNGNMEFYQKNHRGWYWFDGEERSYMKELMPEVTDCGYNVVERFCFSRQLETLLWPDAEFWLKV